MTLSIDIAELSAPGQRIVAPTAPVAARMMAARGVVPGLKPGEIATVIAILAVGADAEVAAAARGTLAKLPAPVLQGALGTDLQAAVVDALARAYLADLEVVGPLLRMPRIADATLEHLAASASEALGELIATNEQRMLATPTVIERLYMNRRVRASTSARLLELAVRNKIELAIPAYAEAATAIMSELIPEPSDEPTADDVLFREVIELTPRLEGEDDDTHEADDEGQEQVKKKYLPVHAKLAQMNVAAKIRCATLGSSAERLMLVRDPNRLVSAAAVQSPLMKESDAVKITASRSVGQDVLRVIALNGEFTRSYQVKLNLVTNPSTPLTFASRMVPHLRDSDLRSMVKSKNVPGAIAQLVRQHLEKKAKRER